MIWKKYKLGDLLEVQNGYAFDSKKFNNLDGMPLIRIRDIKKGNSTQTCYTGVYDKKYIVNSGDLLIGMDGEFRCYQWHGKSALLNQRVCRLQNFSKKLNPKYLSYIINKELKLIEDNTGYITVKHLSSNTIKEILISVPPLKEQEIIIAKLDSFYKYIDNSINIKKNKLNEINLLKTSILQKKFNGDKKKLESLFEITSSKRVFKSEWKKKGVPFYRAREIVKLAKNKPFKNPIYISREMYENYSKKYGSPQEGDILITGVGTLGITYLVKKNDKFYFKDGNIIWLKRKVKNINSNFVEYAFKTPLITKQIQNSIGATVGTLTIQRAKKIEIPLPPIDIQNKIMSEINFIFNLLNQYEDNLKLSLNHYKTLKTNIIEYSLKSVTV